MPHAPQTIAERIIVPLDVPDPAAAIALVEAIPSVLFWKVGLELFVAGGPSILQELKARQKRIFLDLKFHDIPNTVAGACARAARYGVDLLTVHATNGSVGLKAAQTAAIAAAAEAGVAPPAIIAVTVLTSIDAPTLALELTNALPLPEFAVSMAKLAQSAGLAGAVCSPQEAAQLRATCGPDFLLICPGVRPRGSDTGDQKRVMTPQAALAAGASYLVIGRPITASPEPAAAFAQICQDAQAETP
jgi:orotidine-5'-phosphate decarboxylase